VLDEWNRTWSLMLRDEDVTPGEYRISVSTQDVSTERKITIMSNQTVSTSSSTVSTTTSKPDSDSEKGVEVQTNDQELSTVKNGTAESEPNNISENGAETIADDGADTRTEPTETTTPGFGITHAIGVLLTILYLRAT
jgi:uncharacterized membrane protein